MIMTMVLNCDIDGPNDDSEQDYCGDCAVMIKRGR